MPIFRYSGYREDGAEAGGLIEAAGLGDAVSRIKAKGILPAEVLYAGVKEKKGLLSLRLEDDFLPDMTRSLSLLVSSGVPLKEALASLAAGHYGGRRNMLVAVKERVVSGVSLSKALEEHGAVFPDFYINMVHAGEESGCLDKALARLADFLERRNAVKAKVRSAMIYPIFMTAVSIVVLSFLFAFVMPKIVKIFRDTKSALPFITLVLIFISDAFIRYWWILASAAAGGAYYARWFVKTKRALVDKWVLRLPGGVVQSLYYARFSRTLGFLLEGGLPMLRSLSLSAKSMGNMELRAAVERAHEKVAGGQRLSASLEGFPPVFIQLVATGEKSGHLAQTLNRAADAYEEEFNRRVSRAVSLFEPAMILFMGVAVGFIVLAVLLPMLQLNQLVK